ncbi:MAG: PHP-associated domain-containing protein [Promethearchaeia archaeon]
MLDNNCMHKSFCPIPPEKVVKFPIRRQSPLSDILLGKTLRNYGIMQIMSYHLTRRFYPKITEPYMPKKIPENAYLYDFHSHTKYSDGSGTYKDVLDAICLKKHLSGIAITDHPYLAKHLQDNRLLTEKVIERSFKFDKLASEYKRRGKIPEHFLTFPGSCEFFTSLDEENKSSEVEIIGIGLPKDFIQANGGIKRLTIHSNALELIEIIHENNGLVIIPHPFHKTRIAELFRKKLSKNSTPDAVETINYIVGFLADDAYYDFFKMLSESLAPEIKSICQNFGYFNWMATMIAYKNNNGKPFKYPIATKIAPVGSSDAHFISMIGAGCTLIKEPVSCLEDLRKIFHKRKTIPMLNPIWGKKTSKKEVYREIWDKYGDIINEMIKKESFIKFATAKVFVDMVSYLFNREVFKMI